MKRALALSVCTLALLACHERQPAPPPPLPVAPHNIAAPVPAQDDRSTQPAHAQKEAGGRRAASAARKAADLSAPEPPSAGKTTSRKATSGKAAKTPERAPAQTEPSAASGTAPPVESALPEPTAQPAKPASRVNVPRTDHVRAEVPSGLQRDLDADPRMQGWLERAFAVIDDCHARNRAATGAIEALITMHENERPEAAIQALPAPLASVVACATASLTRIKMPLFTGSEGMRYRVRIVFE